ncbi:2-dehydropantoate 2-reductase [Staphylococcus saprophyticus]|uniref:ketopantoate reductase family protein n=1 Tax=Staphylococcus saprophyticus TaxID=29385 RepID=UPI001013D1E1|nr:2-dehydropantoate 2-reductase [Staphylococcus saprophyticus]RXS02298.1 2-dehydropantoate 2-reductase [Staphylococcus saprophyticus]
MYKILVAGAGAMGGRIGVALHQAGHNVTLIDDWEVHVQNINNDGMKIQTETDTYTVSIPAILSKDVADTYDLIILLTKSMQSESMLTQLKNGGAIHENTAILSMMNGLGHEERLSKIVPLHQIYLAVTMWSAGLKGPGHLLLEGTGSINFQCANGVNNEISETIAHILNTANLNATISNNVFEAIWTKVTVNCVLNPLCTILNQRIGEFGAYSKVNEMVSLIINEIVTVAHAKNIEIEADTLLNTITAMYPDSEQGLHYPSMYQDLNNGRPTEIDFLNGQIARYGQKFDVPTPINQMLTHQIHQLERNQL